MNGREKAEFILKRDRFASWLGIKIIKAGEGYCLLEMPVRTELLNAINILHGGVVFSLADTALAFSVNSRSHQYVSLGCQIHYHKKSRNGDLLFAESNLVSENKKIALYDVRIKNREGDTIADFRGTVYKLFNKGKGE
ncbi:MAG: hotdog fold thioesterase [Bergeyella sp.]|nr:hotdog fold thioesterase [Bergeyella sp.]